MIVKCTSCLMWFDDSYRFVYCPHDTFAANDGENNFRHHPESYCDSRDPKDRKDGPTEPEAHAEAEDLTPQPAAPTYCSFCGADCTRSFLNFTPPDPRKDHVNPAAVICLLCVETAAFNIIQETADLYGELRVAIAKMEESNAMFTEVSDAAFQREMHRKLEKGFTK